MGINGGSITINHENNLHESSGKSPFVPMNLPFFRTPGTPDVDCCVTQVAQAAGGLRWTQLGAKCDRHGRITYRILIRYWFVFDENLP